MGFLASAGADLLLNMLVSNQNAYYLGLTVGSVPGSNNSGEELDEPMTDDYTRAIIDNTSAAWVITSGTLYNGALVDFAEAQEDWGTVSGWAVLDQPVGGNVIFAGAMDSPMAVDSGDTVSIPAGGISFSFVTSSWTGQT